VYHDILIALDETRAINNGQPSLWAFLFDHVQIKPDEAILHLGCGTGYYTAIAAELTGTAGGVVAVGVDLTLAERARAALSNWHQVEVRNIDGAQSLFDPVDVIIVSAGATHPVPSWLRALRPGGRLLFPMTSPQRGPGAMLLVTHHHIGTFAARFLCRAGFIDFQGARDLKIGGRLAAALIRDRGALVQSLRHDAHEEDATCWLHEREWCLSLLDP
jgi:protein-L-isoaspartate(D-aspartate) O-methyltransferase